MWLAMCYGLSFLLKNTQAVQVSISFRRIDGYLCTLLSETRSCKILLSQGLQWAQMV